jgi:serine phosphatase RsbU (regulator of sigma subunit)
MSPRHAARTALAALALAALPLRAQEPKPARLQRSLLTLPDGVALDFAWRFAPGDGEGRAAPGFDDSRWIPVVPALGPGALPAGAWPGVGWFRRHLMAAPDLQGRTLAVRIATTGSVDVYLDGRRVLEVGTGGSPPDESWERRDSALVSLEGAEHVLAVRYAYPAERISPGEAFGFRLTLASPAAGPPPGSVPPRLALEGAVVALPLFLAVLHLAFFLFDRRGRWNLWYALVMAVFSVILLAEFQGALLPPAWRGRFAEAARGAPLAATLFGILTYYGVRTDPAPKTRRAFVVAGIALVAVSYLSGAVATYGWQVYFVAVVVEIVRLERSGRTVRRQRAGLVAVSFLVFGVAIVLQILANNGLLPPVAGFSSYYMLGILALAAGVSLSLARELGRTRLVEAENKRKTQELEQARTLQLSMLPGELPCVSGLDVAATTRTAAEVGGDYYDVRANGDGSLLVAFGDATGHGLAAGIVVTAAKALFTSLPVEGDLPGLLSRCDLALRAMRFPGLQMCLSLARITPGAVAVVSAGMPPILVHRAATGEVEELGAGGLPLGSRLPSRLEERRLALRSGDTLLFASDGFAELLDPEGRELGYDGVADAFRAAARTAGAREVVDRLAAAAGAFRGARPQEDDVTFFVVRVEAAGRTSP